MLRNQGPSGSRGSNRHRKKRLSRRFALESLEKRLLLFSDLPAGPFLTVDSPEPLAELRRLSNKAPAPGSIGGSLGSGTVLSGPGDDSTGGDSPGDDSIDDDSGTCDGFTSPGGVGGSSTDFFREVTVSEGVLSPVDVASLDSFSGSTPYAPRTNVALWYARRPWADGNGVLEFSVAANGSVGNGAPFRIQLDGFDRLAADGIDFKKLGTWRRSSEALTGGQAHESYRSLFALDNRFFVHVDFDINGPAGVWCDSVDVPSTIFIAATWIDLEQYQFRVDWGDGQSGLGSAQPIAGGSWIVGGSHTYEWSQPDDPYRPLMSYYMQTPYGWQLRGSKYDGVEVTVPDALHWIEDSEHQANVDGEVFLVALLTDRDPLTALYRYDVNVDWGDGSSSAGQLEPKNDEPGVYRVTGLHVYNAIGSYTGTIHAIASDGSVFVGSFYAEVTTLRPDAEPNQYTVIHDRQFSANLLFPSGANAGRTVTLDSTTSQGSLVLNPNGVFTYLPNYRFIGTDSFVYRIWENGIPSFPITVTFQVVNHAPVAGNDAWYVSHDRRFVGQVFGNDRDVDGDPFTAMSVTQPSQGSFSFSQDGRFTYLPAPGFQGIDQFAYVIDDGLASSNLATVTLDVGNRLPPLELNQNYTLRHDRDLVKPWPATDPDGDTIQAYVRVHPQRGSVAFDPSGTWTYTPQPSYVGPDSFSFAIYDGLLESATAVVVIDVINRAPIGTDDQFTLSHDRELREPAPGIFRNDSDEDQDTLSASLVENVQHGRLELQTDGGFIYQPNPLFVGQDSFRYVLSDGIDSTDPILVIFEIEEHAPDASDLLLSDWPHDQTLIDDLKRTVSDLDTDELFFTLEFPPAVGTLVLQPNGEFAYSPPRDYRGPVSFGYRVSDPLLMSDMAIVSFDVVQSLPTAELLNHRSVSHDRLLRGNALSNVRDTDRNEYLSAKLLSGPSYGTIAFNSNGSYSYRPQPGFVSQDPSQWDSFSYQASDGRGQTAVVTQTIAVVNSNPITVSDEYFLPHNRVLSATLTVVSGLPNPEGMLLAPAPYANDYDTDADTLAFILVDPFSGQEITVASLGLQNQLTWNGDGTFLFDPGTRRHADIEFYYVATDGLSFSQPAQILIHIQDTAPMARDDMYHVVHSLQLVATRDTTYLQPDVRHADSLIANDTNLEGDTLTATLFDPGTGLALNPLDWNWPGTLQWHGDGTFVYEPQLGFSGDITFAYQLSDGFNLSNTALVTIRVARPGPTVESDPFFVWHDTSLNANVYSNDTVHGSQVVFQLLDANGQALDFAAGTQALGLEGVLSWNIDGSFTYTPPPQWIGSESFRYQVFDGIDTSPPALVEIVVENRVPEPADNWRRVVPGQTYSATIASRRFRPPLLNSVVDRELDPLTVQLVSGVQHGTLQLSPNGEFHYTPDSTFRGVDGFVYRFFDGLSQSELAQVVFNVTNRPAQAVDDSYQAYSGIKLEGNVTYNDLDPDGDPIRAVLLDPDTLQPVEPAHFSEYGQLQWNAYGGFELIAAQSAVGTLRLAYLASDPLEGTDLAFVNIAIANPSALNRPPVARNDSLSVSPGRSLVLPSRTQWDGNVRRMPIGFNDRDPEGDVLTYQLLTAPSSGQLTLAVDGSLSYTPAGGNGTNDSFQYRISDGINFSNVATVALSIINHAPQARNAMFESPHDQTLSASLTTTTAAGLRGAAVASDEDADPLSFVVVAMPQHGTLTLQSGGAFTYTPDAGYVGLDRFTYQASDGMLASSVATIVLSVINDRPQAFSKTYKLAHDTRLDAQVPPRISRDLDESTVQLAGGPFYGNLSLATDGRFEYTPPVGFVGRDTFTYYWRDVASGPVNSQSLSGNFAQITIEVMSRAPITTSDTFNLSFGRTNYELDVLANDIDPDAKGISIVAFTQPTRGSVSLLPTGRLLYTPHNPNTDGTDRFLYQVQGSDYTSLLTEVTVNLTPLNLLPAAIQPQAAERQQFNLHLADLFTTLTSTTTAEYQVVVDFGDGQFKLGTLVPAGLGFQVVAAHAYERPGSYTATIKVTHLSGHQVSVKRSVAVNDTPAQVTAQALVAIKRLPFQAVLATLVDDAFTNVGSYTASVNWGDGLQSVGNVRSPAPGRLEIVQGHMYARSGTFPIAITLTDPLGVAQVIHSTATVSHVVTVQGLAAPIQGREVDGLVGRFNSNSIASQANQFIATIDWGDGISSPGMIVGENGRFEVFGTHRYDKLDTYDITLLITEDDPSQTIVHAKEPIREPGSTIRVLGRNFEVVEGQRLESTLVLAEFVDSDREVLADAFSVTIDWGDGQDGQGTVTGVAGNFQIGGSHQYAQAGSYQLKFTVRKTDSDVDALGVSSLLVTHAALFGTARTITESGNRVVIASFVDTAAGSDYSARIRLAPGQYLPVEVQKTPTASVSTLANGQPRNSKSSNPYERQQLKLNTAPQAGTFTLSFDGESTVALAYDASAADVQAALSGLDTTDQVTVSGGSENFTITFGGAHAYQDVPQIVVNGNALSGGQNQLSIFADTRALPPGNLEIQVYQAATSRLTIRSTFSPPTSESTFSDTAHPPTTPPNLLARSGDVTNVIEATGVTISTTRGALFDGIVANVLGDSSGWEAEINWGDGATSPGTITAGHVTGSHTYDHPGAFRISVALRKLDPVGTSQYDPWFYDSFAVPGNYWAWGNFGSLGWNYYPWWNSSSWQGESWRQGDAWVGGVVSGATIHAATLSVTPSGPLTAHVDEQLADVRLLTSNASASGLAVIQWGDGKTSEGTISGGDVVGSHVYAQPGYYTARITLRDGQQIEITTVEIKVTPTQGWPNLVAALDPGDIRGVEQSELADVVVAKFVLDTPRRIGGLHQASIDWGDGRQSLGKIEASGSGNQVVVKGTHTYREAGAYNISVSLLEQALAVEVHVTAIIAGRELEIAAVQFPAAVGQQLHDVIVGEFTVGGAITPNAKDYSAQVDWGDGSSSSARIVRVGDKLLVVGSHLYIQTGQFRTTVSVEDGPVATRRVSSSATIRVAHTYAGGEAIDVFTGTLGQRKVSFDVLGTAHDLTQWSHQAGNDYFGFSFSQSWDRYHGFVDLTETIAWGDGAANDLTRELPYYNVNTAGTLGSFNYWGWGNGYLGGWYSQGSRADGWSGFSSNFENNPTFWYNAGWYGLGYGALAGLNWNGYHGWNSSFGWEGFYGWSGYYGWSYGDWFNGLSHSYWPYQYLNGRTPSSGSGSYDSPELQASWSHEISSTSAYFDSSLSSVTVLGYGFNDWQSACFAFPSQRNTGTTQHRFEDSGEFATSTTFGLSRTFQVADVAIQSPDVRATIVGYEDEALADVLLATLVTSDWEATISDLSAEVDWGDGTASMPVDVSQTPSGRMAIRGSHTYGDEGDYSVSIVVRSSGGASRVLTSRAVISDRLLSLRSQDIFALEQETSAQIVVATLDAFRGDANNFSVTIDWGDRDFPPSGSLPTDTPHLSRGEIRLNSTSGKWEVLGQHAYERGTNPVNFYEVRVQIADHSQQPVVVESLARVSSGWTATAQARNQGFGESHQVQLGGPLISTNTGELLLAHELDFDLSPGTAIGGNPQLVFNSATTVPRPIIQAVLSSDVGREVPSHFEARLIWNYQEPTPWTSYAGGNFASGTDYLVAVQAPFPVRQTGVYDWTIEVRIHVGLSQPLTASESGKSVVVVQNWADVDPSDPFEATAAFGMGWHLSTLDRLMIQNNGDVIYVNGLGFPRLFENPHPAGNLPFQLAGPPNEFGVLQFDPIERSFVYTSKDQVRKHFNSLGLMYLIQRPGLPGEFYNYDEQGRLIAIQTIDGAQTTIDYSDMNAAYIAQPGGRGVGLSNPFGQLLSINEKTGSRRFNYSSGNLVSSGWGVLDSTFVYGAHGRIFQVHQGPESLSQLYPASVQGLQPFAQTLDQDVALLVDPLGRQSWYTMDVAGRILSYQSSGAATGTTGQVETWQRDQRFQITAHTGPLGTSTFGFDAQGNLSTHNSLGQGTTTFGYDPHFNRPLTTLDPNGNSTQYQLDSLTGFTSQMTNASGDLATNVYSNGLLLATIGLNGATTNYEYDARRRLTSELGPQNRNRYQTYDNFGNLKTVQDASGAVTTFTYDARNRLTRQTDALGNSTNFTYDASGLLISRVDPNGRRVQYTYDQRGFQLSVTEGVGSQLARSSSTVYDAVGNPIEQYDPQGFVTLHAYDARNRRTTTLDAGGGVTQYFYDQADQLVGSIDRAGRTWTYHYDSLGRQIGVTDPLGRTTAQILGWTGNVTSEIDRAGRITTHAYDAQYRRIASSFEGQVTQFEYDAAGNVVRLTDPLGRQTVFSYDLLNQQVAMQDALGNTWFTSYDAIGNAIATLDPLGRTNATTYDPLRRPVNHVDAAGNYFAWTYDSLGNVSGIRDGLGHWTTSSFDLHNRRIAETDADGYSNLFEYDLRDVMVASVDKLGRRTSYQADALGQVTAVQDPSLAVWQFAYDMAGNTTAQLDPLLRSMLNVYDSADRLVSTQDAAGNMSTVTYDAADNVMAMTDPLGRLTSYEYDAFDRRTRAIDALGNQTSWQYDAVGNVLTESRPLGRVTNFQYDALDRLTRTTDALGNQVLASYNAVGNLVSSTDALGYSTTYAYDTLNRTTSVTDALGNQTTRSFDANGNTLSVTDPLGRTTTTTYDRLNRMEASSDPLGGSTRYQYDSVGNVRTVKNAAGSTQTTSYDVLNRPVTIKTLDFGARQFTYDAVGNTLTDTDGNGVVVYSTYDVLNRAISTTDALGNTSRVAYDPVGNVVETIDPLGHTSRISYDALNRPLISTDALGYATHFGYDALGNRLSLTDPSGNTTTWNYDLLDRVTTETNSLGQSQTSAYDAVGNRTSLTKRDGRIIASTFDPLRRMTSEQWFTAGTLVETLGYVYDAASQMVQATDQRGNASLAWQYDSLGRVATETQVLGSPAAGVAAGPTVTLSNAYDPIGRRIQLVASLNGQTDSTTNYSLDRGGRVTRIAQVGENVSPKSVDFAYDRGGRIARTTRYADSARTQLVAQTTTSFDAAGRLSGLQHDRGPTQFAHYALTWDVASRLSTLDSLVDGLASFTYDAVNQLTSTVYAQPGSQNYSYDANGNRSGGDHQTGSDNQLLSNGQASFAYDPNGNLIRSTDAATGAVIEYTYDHRDRLTDVRFRNSLGGALVKQVHYAYDPLDRRTALNVDMDGDSFFDRTEFHVNDGLPSARNGAGDALLLVVDASGDVLSRYLHGLAVDEILAEENIDPATGLADVLWTLGDHQGSISDFVRYDSLSAQVAVVDHVFYDAFGQVGSETAPAIEHRFGYTGREWDDVSGLQYSRRRYYDPSTARFLSRDPLSFAAGDMNLYRYVGNHPTYATDPSGLDDVETFRSVPNSPTWADRRRGWSDYWNDRGTVVWKGANDIAVGRSDGDWVYYGDSRATLTAVEKAAASIQGATSGQMRDRLAGIVSPFRINRASNELGIFFGGTNQHIHDIGNVERLYNLFQGSKFYHGGIGHPVDYKRDTISGGTGWGFEAGIALALKDVLAHYEPGTRISIYGWSRGAAQGIELARDLEALGIPVEFLGLFDPVYSVGSAGHGSRYIVDEGLFENYVAIPTPGNVRVATAIYAMNEDRSWFPATRLWENGTTQLNLIGSPGAHGEVGGHWESNMQIQQLNLRAMIEFARGHGGVTFEWRGIDPQIQGILSSVFGQQIALRGYLGEDEFIDKKRLWDLASQLRNWNAYSAAQFQTQLHSNIERQWRPGGFGTQNWDGINPLVILGGVSKNARAVVGNQPAADHYRRDLPWVQLGLWDIYPGNEGARPFIESLYNRRINPRNGGWR